MCSVNTTVLFFLNEVYTVFILTEIVPIFQNRCCVLRTHVNILWSCKVDFVGVESFFCNNHVVDKFQR